MRPFGGACPIVAWKPPCVEYGGAPVGGRTLPCSGGHQASKPRDFLGARHPSKPGGVLGARHVSLSAEVDLSYRQASRYTVPARVSLRARHMCLGQPSSKP